jgi:tRNA U34 5-carboxymethylaminomethyl modifying GTPase MnmE/TrmE
VLLRTAALTLTVKGSARARFEQLRTEIIGCLAKVEALIDFGEGEEIEEGVYEEGWYTISFYNQQT